MEKNPGFSEEKKTNPHGFFSGFKGFSFYFKFFRYFFKIFDFKFFSLFILSI